MSNQTEMNGVELPAIELLQQMGWEYKKGSELNVPNKTLAPILEEHLKQSILRINDWMNEGQLVKVLQELRKINEESLILSNKKFWENFIQKSSIQVDHTENGVTLKRSVNLIDSVNPQNNHFLAVNQFIGKNSSDDEFRPDILLFVNGLPLGIIECKASHEKVENGVSQILGYQKSFEKHFIFNQVCIAINRVKGLYGAIRTPQKFYFSYRLEENEINEVREFVGENPTEQDKLLWALLEPTRFIELVRHFVLFETTNDGVVKKLPRYQQWRAIRKSTEAIKQDKGGVVWHTQGSGKSLTMGLLARYLRTEQVGLNNPSILLLTDRTDLDRQIFNTFTNIGLHPEQARSVDGLQQRLTNDFGGIFTSTIQKFQEQSKNTHKVKNNWQGDNQRILRKERANQPVLVEYQEKQKHKWVTVKTEESFTKSHRKEKDGKWFVIQEEFKDGNWEIESEQEVDFQVLSTKKNFYVLVDEAHRSHYGFLGAFMRASLPNAKLLAFTGTPLLKDEKNTLSEFGGSDYIDVYALQEAVKDGFTLPIRYVDGIAEQTVDGLLEGDFDKKFEDETEIKKALLKKALVKKRRLNKTRFRKIAEHLVEHYESNGFAKGFKAMLVCEGRYSAIAYKEILNELMEEREESGRPTFDSRVVISLGGITANRSTENADDDEELSDEEREKLLSIEERVNNAVRDGLEPIAVPSDDIPELTNRLFKLPFKNSDGEVVVVDDSSEEYQRNPKFNGINILIVSDMLLTGYDAPILNTLYLDKPLKEHTLLQAIARVNRTFKGKSAGYIVDYYGIIPHLDEALKIYGGDVEPDQIMKSPTTDIPHLEASLQKIIDLLPKKYDILEETEKYKQDAELALNPINHIDKAEEFIDYFGEFSKVLDRVLPHPKGAPYKPYFVIFSYIKITLMNLMQGDEHREALTLKDSLLLEQLAEEHIQANDVVSLLGKEISIFNREELSQLRGISGSTASLVMQNQLKNSIKVGLTKDPSFFGSLDEELTKLLEEEREGRIEQLSFLEQLESLTDRIRRKDEQALDAGFADIYTIATFNYLKQYIGDNAKAITESIFDNEVFDRTVNSDVWKSDGDTANELRKHLRDHLKVVSDWKPVVANQHAKAILEVFREL